MQVNEQNGNGFTPSSDCRNREEKDRVKMQVKDRATQGKRKRGYHFSKHTRKDKIIQQQGDCRTNNHNTHSFYILEKWLLIEATHKSSLCLCVLGYDE